MLVHKALIRYGDLMAHLMPKPSGDYSLYARLYPVIRAIDEYYLSFQPEDAELLERVGESYHVEKRLKQAADYYAQALAAEPPSSVTAEMRQAIVRHAPLLQVAADEFFALKDVLAFHHPQCPLIAYHLFWEDDYDFPDDHDPCDHEQLWVAYDPANGQVTGIWSFYHSVLLTTDEAVSAANAAGGRPSISVQWGKHGSLVVGWESIRLADRTVMEDMEQTWAHVAKGGRAKDHPIKQRFWPQAYRGSLADFVHFPTLLDTRDYLKDEARMLCTALSNAATQQLFLTYNFAPKYGWPWQAPVYGEQGRCEPALTQMEAGGALS